MRVEVVEDGARGGEIARAAGERTAQLIAAMRRLDVAALMAASHLPGWSRLTVVCHLRYGASALLRMTEDTLAGRVTSYYPEGRAAQRPATLLPDPGEQPGEVLEDWAHVAARLDSQRGGLESEAWALTISEPEDNTDLGSVPLGRLALAR